MRPTGSDCLHVCKFIFKMLSLPDDVLFIIFAFCDTATLGKLCLVCKRFRLLASSDCLWLNSSRKCVVANQSTDPIQSRSCKILPAKERCRVSFNWVKAWTVNTALSKFSVRFMPWLSLCSRRLWVAEGNSLKAYRHLYNGRLKHSKPLVHIRTQGGDVCRFVINDDIIVSGESDGSVQGWCEDSGLRLFHFRDCHQDEVTAIDFIHDVILTGSRDKFLKLWTLDSKKITNKLTIDLKDRIWSLALNPLKDTFVCGTSGCNESPLMQFDTESGRHIGSLGGGYLHGAGVLYCAYESPKCLMSGGYDTFIRQWDTRSQTCTMRWENPYDMTVYCLASNHNFTFLSGSSSFGLVWLWDKRMTRPIQHYYVGKGNSPVYSLAFDPYHMYVALDRGIHLQDFGSFYSHTRNNFR